MSKYHDKEMEEMNHTCVYCIHFQDILQDVKHKSIGEGTCTKKNIAVDAYDGCINDFHCIIIR